MHRAGDVEMIRDVVKVALMLGFYIALIVYGFISILGG